MEWLIFFFPFPGDERPCERCIKRNISHACQDGVRKKAKYLHDTPDGALVPQVASHFYNNSNNNNNDSNGDQTSANDNSIAALGGLPLVDTEAVGTEASTGSAAAQPQQQSNGAPYYATPQSGSYNVYQDNSIGQSPFATQSPASPAYDLKKTNAAGRNPSMSSNVSQPPVATSVSGPDSQAPNPFAGPLFDPSDPALFNFDLSSMNFENRYGALEFGMLGHMATGAGDSGDSPSDSATTTQRGGSIGGADGQFSTTPAPTTTGTTGFAENSTTGNAHPFNVFGSDPLLNEWSAGSQQHVNVNSVYPNNNVIGGHVHHGHGPRAFAIESGPTNFASPGSVSSPQVTAALEENAFSAVNSSGGATTKNGLAANGQRPVMPPPSAMNQAGAVSGASKRRQRNPSSIYESVKEPYSYTSGFHSLTAFIQHRFPPQKRLQIAKALASIRPSLIATSKTLNRDDLIFMEKSFQRTLWEYEDFINACGTPTIVLRRTGEIAAVGKEFSILTGWKKEVLLGKEPNLNVNTGGSGPHVGALSRGGMFPQGNKAASDGRIQPVFLAELLDDESVVEFYNDFAQLAFGDSRGSVMTTCNLLKYKTQEDTDIAHTTEDGHMPKGGISGEAGMNRLGFKDGKVECAYCWTVKRDVFDIPMLIVMNVS